MGRLLLLLCLMAAGSVTVGVPAAAQGDIYGARRLAPDTYAYVDKSGANCGFVVCQEGVVAVDTGGSSIFARDLLKAIAGVTSRRVCYVINTHYDYESTFGNCIVGKASTIVSHSNCKTALAEKGEKLLHEMRAAGKAGLDEITIKLPVMLIWRSRDLAVFGKKIELVSFTWSHSPGDLCVWLPNEKVLFCGDLVFSNQMPDFKDANTKNWIRALSSLALLEAETIVPAHGVLCDSAAIETTRGFLQSLVSRTKKAKASGMTREEAVAKVDMSEYSKLVGYDGLVGVAIGRAYDEIE